MIQNWFKKNKIPFVFISPILLLLVIAWILYLSFGRQFIMAMYEEKLTGVLDKLIQHQNVFPLDYYIGWANSLFFGLSFYFCIGATLLFLVCAGKNKLIFYGIVISYILYCIIFITKASFIIDGIRYFTLFDDAMISMRYAKNLAAGYGLVWNPGGPKVEGYTNFLWTIYMSFWHLFPISSAKISLPIQISNLICLVVSLFLVKKIGDDISGRNKYVSMGAVLLTASYLPINVWALRGMETPIIGFIVLFAILRVFRCLEYERFEPSLFVILGVGMLARADLLVIYIGISLFMIILLPENRKEIVLVAFTIFLLIMGCQTLFRWLYYNDILPNTYYLKVAGVSSSLRIQRGLWAAKQFIKTMSVFFFVLPFIYSLLRIKNKKVLFLLYIFLLQLSYSIYVGGDTWEKWGYLANRYLCIVMPGFFILLFLMVTT